jgi:hypothetical protein
MPRRCSANSPGEAIPATVRHGRCQSRDTVPPTLVRLTRRALEIGRRNPRRGTDAYSALARGHALTSGASPSSPSALCGHPSHCSAIPDAVETRGDRTSPRPLLCPVRPLVSSTLELACGRPPNEHPLHRHPRSRSWTDTGHAMTSRQKQDSLGRPSTPRHCTSCLHM